jgi:hypothetical protein
LLDHPTVDPDGARIVTLFRSGDGDAATHEGQRESPDDEQDRFAPKDSGHDVISFFLPRMVMVLPTMEMVLPAPYCSGYARA